MPFFFLGYLFDGAVGERVSGHVEKQEILFLGGEDAFLNQVFGQSFPDIPQLVVQLKGTPRLS